MGVLKSLTAAVSLAVAFAGSVVHAGTIDFTDGVFTVVGTEGDVPVIIEEMVDGVTFTLSTNGTRGQRIVPDEKGLDFGRPGNALGWLTITPDQDVKITSIMGISESVGDGAPFTIDYPGPSGDPLSIGFATVSSKVSLFGGGIDVAAGEGFYINEYPYRGVLTQGYISSIDFERAPEPAAPVPLPAGLPLLAAALGAFAWLRRRA